MVNIHRTNQIVRADQFVTVMRFQVRQIEHAELAQSDQQPHREIVFDVTLDHSGLRMGRA